MPACCDKTHENAQDDCLRMQRSVIFKFARSGLPRLPGVICRSLQAAGDATSREGHHDLAQQASLARQPCLPTMHPCMALATMSHWAYLQASTPVQGEHDDSPLEQHAWGRSVKAEGRRISHPPGRTTGPTAVASSGGYEEEPVDFTNSWTPDERVFLKAMHVAPVSRRDAAACAAHNMILEIEPCHSVVILIMLWLRPMACSRNLTPPSPRCRSRAPSSVWWVCFCIWHRWRACTKKLPISCACQAFLGRVPIPGLSYLS
jgi:hypothetical protein